MVQVFLDNLLPIFLIAGAGYAVGRHFQTDLKTVARLSFYIFSPCLVFTSLKNAEISSAGLGQMFAFTLALTGVMIALGWGVGLALRLERAHLAAFIIAVVFVNSGNYGLPLIQFAFSPAALNYAIIFFVTSTLSVYTLGVVIATLGRQSGWGTLRAAFTLPATYALFAALGLRLAQWTLPVALERAVTLLGQAALPVMLVMLGLQIASSFKSAPWTRTQWQLIGLATFMQLVITPLVGVGLGWALGLRGAALQAGLVEAAMPTAVITTILGVEYDLDLTLLNGTVMLSTLLSPLTLTPLIAYLQSL